MHDIKEISEIMRDVRFINLTEHNLYFDNRKDIVLSQNDTIENVRGALSFTVTKNYFRGRQTSEFPSNLIVVLPEGTPLSEFPRQCCTPIFKTKDDQDSVDRVIIGFRGYPYDFMD
jgi:hypothetical protein